jgi:predicted nucleic acid-binding protein
VAGPGRKFFDSNALVYLFDLSEPAKRARAAEVWEAAVRADEVVVSAQVLQEFFVVVTRLPKSPLSIDDAEAQVRRLARFEVVRADAGLLLAAIERVRRSRISFGDALVVEAALAAGCATLYTEDLNDGWLVDDRLQVVNPFVSREA